MGDPTSWSETQSITLSSSVFKLFSQLLLARGNRQIQHDSPLQWAATGKRATEFLVALRRVVQLAKDWSSPTWIVKLRSPTSSTSQWALKKPFQSFRGPRPCRLKTSRRARAHREVPHRTQRNSRSSYVDSQTTADLQGPGQAMQAGTGEASGGRSKRQGSLEVNFLYRQRGRLLHSGPTNTYCLYLSFCHCVVKWGPGGTCPMLSARHYPRLKKQSQKRPGTFLSTAF